MGLSLDRPWMLLAWPLALAAARGTRGWTGAERAFLAVTAGAIALALAGPRLGVEPAPRRVWIAVDRSASAADRPGARDWIDQARGILGALEVDDEAGVLLFGADAAVGAGPERPSSLARRLASVAVPIDGDASDLGGCLALADRLDGGRGEVVLIADGRDTQGATAYAPPSGRRISAIAPHDAPDWRIARVDAPARLAPGEPCRMHVAIEGSAAGSVRLVLFRAGRRVQEVGLALDAPGRTTVILADLPEDPGEAGRIRYRLELETEARDAWPGNNAYDVPVELALRPRLLWVTADPKGPWTAHWARTLAGIALLEPVAPAEAARRFEDDRGIDGVAIADVPAEALGSDEAIPRYVERGGGLVFLAGRASLAGGGYLGGRIEAVLPVLLGPRPDEEPPGVAILIDCSGSMKPSSTGGPKKLELARAGAIDIVRHLELGARVGVWAFADAPELVEPLAVLATESARNALLARLEAWPWTASGGTKIARALGTAIPLLQAAHPSGPRHAVLVSDGASTDVVQDEGAIEQLLATSGRAVVLTVVRVGHDAADAETALARLAGRSGGRLVPVAAPEELPRMMLDGYRRARHGLVADPGRRAMPGPALERAPGLRLPVAPLGEVGRTPARGQDEAVLAWADGADPIVLGAWREHEGGGRAAYVQLGADGDPSWGADRADRAHADAMVAACVGWTLDRMPVDLAWQLEFDAGVLDAWVREGEAARDDPALQAHRGYRIRTERGATFPLEPRGRGLWNGTLALGSGLHDLELQRIGADGTARPTGLFRTIAIPFARELARTEADVPRLRDLVDATGGQWLERATDYRPAPRSRRPGRPCAAELLLLAACLVIARAIGAGLGRL